MTRDWLEAQRRHFDRQVADYTVMYGAGTPFHDAMTDRLMQLATPCEGEWVLDLGCGIGRTTVPLLQRGCRVTGLDISRPTLEALEERVDRLGLSRKFQTLCQAAEYLDEVDRYHLVIGRGFLHHLQDPIPVLRRIRSSLKPGGRAVFMDPNPLQPGWLPFHLFHPTLSVWMERYLWRGFPAWTCRSLRKAGLDDVECRYAGLVPPPLWGRVARTAEFERWLTGVPGVKKLALYLMVRGTRSGGNP